MHRLLIVDNERIVVDSLVSYFERRQPDLIDVIGVYSAYEALQIMGQTKVDVLLTDIRMPGMDGLQLQKEVSERWPWCQTIFLTGYSDFAFIQEALRGGGVDYLLKTEGNQAVEKAVLHTVELLDNQLRTDELMRRAHEQYQQALPLLRERLLLSLAQGKTQPFENLPARFQQMEIPLNPTCVWPVLVFIEADESFEKEDIDLQLTSIEQVAREYLRSRIDMAQVWLEEHTLLWLFSIRSGSDKGMFLRGALEVIQHHCQAKLGLMLSVCLADGEKSWEALSETVDGLRHRLNSQIRRDRNGRLISGLLISLRDENDLSASLSGDVRTRLMKIPLMETYLESGNRYEFEEALSVIHSILEHAPESMVADLRLEVHYSLLSMLLRQMNHWNLRMEVTRNFNMNRLSGDADWRERDDTVRIFAEAVFDAKMKIDSEEDDNLVSRVNRTVQSNLGGDLSLICLGDMEGLSPSYLAKVYKGISGESLKKYISRSRMDKAQKLLRETELLGREIGAAVGFSTEQSFYRFFKAMCGLTPQEYRQSQGQSQ